MLWNIACTFRPCSSAGKYSNISDGNKPQISRISRHFSLFCADLPALSPRVSADPMDRISRASSAKIQSCALKSYKWTVISSELPTSKLQNYQPTKYPIKRNLNISYARSLNSTPIQNPGGRHSNRQIDIATYRLNRLDEKYGRIFVIQFFSDLMKVMTLDTTPLWFILIWWHIKSCLSFN